ncbi:phosphoribosylglycinamide formyltransferase [Shouchella lonarensis]|uniref:Phosphoribosylglycinamide formyltransferase n=1 Tax=Shouchella lonarensis TaxID=1464122 RepID=A0A1G6MMX0_9BACI|nr:phosphoribosylglycinamide formyltransferase [Shouchella lonarensis]SDC56928.1 formyltetrahydrofolate-dependent phosphoribosylglycinamide formyltransferase [Shouchella lonarensis]
MKLAIFASGTGSNARALIQAAKRGVLGGEVVAVVSDRPKADVLQMAASYDIPAYGFSPRTFQSKTAYEQAVLERLQAVAVDFILLAGYMRLVGPTLLAHYEGRIVNIHPSLLPNFPGLDAVGQALRAGVQETGVTIHYVDAGMDTGPVIMQQTVPIDREDTHETLTKKIKAVEHALYPTCIQQLLMTEAEVKR